MTSISRMPGNMAPTPSNSNRLMRGAAAILVGGLLISGIKSCGGSESPEVLPVPEVDCNNGVGSMVGEIDNMAHGGVDQVWTEDEIGKGSMVLSYDLQKGETLSEVAACFYENIPEGVAAIAGVNNIEDPNIAPIKKLFIIITDRVRATIPEDINSINELADVMGIGVNQLFAANALDINTPGATELWKPKPGETIYLPIQRDRTKDDKPATTTTTSSPNITTTTVETPDSGEIDREAEIDDFRAKWNEYASATEKEFGIDRNAVLAQAILESSYGSSDLAIDGNNLFGVKAHRGAEPTPYWSGDTISKETTEFLTDAQLEDPYWQKRLISSVGKTEAGLNEVRVKADFRSHKGFMDSFSDYGYKITTEPAYAKAAALIGDDPKQFILAIAESGYATDPVYSKKVTEIYSILVELAADGEPEPPIPAQPKKGPGEVVDPKKIDFANFPTQERDDEIKETIKLAASNVSLDDFENFRKSGILDKTELTQSIMTGEGEYEQLFGRERSAKLKYIVLHLWANGISDDELDAIAGTESSSSQGNSHDITLTAQITSWHNGYLGGRPSSAHYLFGDNGEAWRLTSDKNKTLHAGNGVIDEGRNYFSNVNNEDSIAFEFQADTFYDLTEQQFLNLFYGAADRLIANELVTPSMSSDEIREAVNAAIVGHGKNDSKFNDSGVEFGWRYRDPLVNIISELIIADFSQ